jgi:hemerythrin-like domain-containing protein
MDAIELLENDHTKFRKLLDELEATTERGVKTREELFNRLSLELSLHETIEEEIFYPALAEHPKTEELVNEGVQEHHVADVLVSELAALAPGNEVWTAKAKVLKESIEHHLEEEEQKMFPLARRVFTREELGDLGEDMEARRDDALTSLAKG